MYIQSHGYLYEGSAVEAVEPYGKHFGVAFEGARTVRSAFESTGEESHASLGIGEVLRRGTAVEQFVYYCSVAFFIAEAYVGLSLNACLSNPPAY